MIDATEQYEDEEEKLTVTRLVLNKHPYGQAMRILQAEDGQVDVLGEGFIQAIDPASMNTDYEYEIEGPFINRHFPKQVYWKSGATTIAVTNFKDSVISKYADLLICTSQDQLFYGDAIFSRASQIVLVDMIYMGLIVSDYEKYAKCLDQSAGVIKDKAYKE